MPLSSFPPELLFLICEYAWNSDSGGHLSLVSKQFRDITVPLQYRCVSMTSSKRSIALIPKDLPAFHRVRHLFVSHAPPSWMDCLREVADTLETLCVDLPSTSLLSCVFRVRFPRLRELTVNGFYPFPARMDMPQLKRLHLAGHRNPQGLLEQCAGMWGGLEVLRISGATGAYMFAKEVQDVLRPDGDDSDSLMESLKLLIVQLGPEIPTKKRADEQMIEVLRNVAQQKKEDGPRVVVVEDRLEGSKLDSKQAMAIWRDGVDGLDSRWQ